MRDPLPREPALRDDARATFLAALEYGVHPLLKRRPTSPFAVDAPAPATAPPPHGITWVKGPDGILRPAHPRTTGGAR